MEYGILNFRWAKEWNVRVINLESSATSNFILVRVNRTLAPGRLVWIVSWNEKDYIQET